MRTDAIETETITAVRQATIGIMAAIIHGAQINAAASKGTDGRHPHSRARHGRHRNSTDCSHKASADAKHPEAGSSDHRLFYFIRLKVLIRLKVFIKGAHQ